MPTKAKDAHPTTQGNMLVDHFNQHPGPVQVTRSVYVKVPGKHVPALAPTERSSHFTKVQLWRLPSVTNFLSCGGLFEERSLVVDCL